MLQPLLSLFLLLTAISCGVFEKVDNSNLLAVVVTHRHGERNIFHILKNDPKADEINYPEGYGELRKVGKQHHFALGKWFRERYDGFLPRKYSPKDIRVQSTDVDRTLMSVSSQLAGLYPPVEDQVWNPQLKWQPIPIHTKPFKEDIVVGGFVDCPKYDAMYKKLDQSEEMMQKKNRELLKYLYEHTGENVTTFMELIEIHDTLFVEHHDFGFHLPEWTKKVYPEPLDSLSALGFKTFSYDAPLARLRVGPFFHEILSNFNKSIRGETVHKYSIYSAHDLNVANILQTFQDYNDIRPPYASAVIIELRQNKTNPNDHYVNVLYKNSTVEEPPVKIYPFGCDFDCNIKTFAHKLENISIDVDTWKQECGGAEAEKLYEELFQVPYESEKRKASQFVT